MLQIFEGIEADLVPSRGLAQPVVKRRIEAKLRIAECRDKHRHTLFIGRLQNSPLSLRMLRQVRSDGVVQFVRAHHFVVVPSLQHCRHNFFDVIQVLFRLERVVDTVVPLFVEFNVRNFGIGLEVGAPSSLDQTVSHERASGHNGIYYAAVDQLSDDQPLFGDCHGPGQGHHDKSVFIQRHGFEHVGCFPQLASGEGGLRHGTNQAINGMNFREIERFQRDQPVFYGIVQATVFALSRVRLFVPVRISLITLFHRKPPSFFFFPDQLLYKMGAFGCHGRTWRASLAIRAQSKLQHMPGKKAFEQQIADLDSLRLADRREQVQALEKALGNRNNFIVGKASDLIREFKLTGLTDALAVAFERFLKNPEKTDPQCWAKNAIARTLAAFEYQEADFFLRGMHHIQLEPVWGGRSDTAGTLRATCALALVQCRSLAETDLLSHLIDVVADKDKAVRLEVVRAIEQVGSPAASLLLRLRAVLGSDEPEVLGACYGGILRLEGGRAIPWVAGFLVSADDTAGEAALAIAATHSPEGFTVLRERFGDAKDPWWRSVLLSAMALTRLDIAMEFLLDVVRTESLDAEGAIEAILRAAPSHETISALESLVRDNPRLATAFAAHRSSG